MYTSRISTVNDSSLHLNSFNWPWISKPTWRRRHHMVKSNPNTTSLHTVSPTLSIAIGHQQSLSKLNPNGLASTANRSQVLRIFTGTLSALIVPKTINLLRSPITPTILSLKRTATLFPSETFPQFLQHSVNTNSLSLLTVVKHLILCPSKALKLMVIR